VTLRERQVGNVIILDIDGRITVDDDGDQTLREKFRELVRSGHADLVLNLERVSYVGTAGLGAIVFGHISATRRGGALRLVRVAARVRDALATTRLLSVLDLCDSEAEALARFSAPG